MYRNLYLEVKMCEPHHSIVQFPTDDDSPSAQGGLSTLGKVMDWGKKVWEYFHFSKLGSGHTESMYWARAHGLSVPTPTLYETAWWSRNVRLDGSFVGNPNLKNTGLEAARIYSNDVVLGSMGKLRQFLTMSIVKSDRPESYAAVFVDSMLNAMGRQQFTDRWRKIFRESFYMGAYSIFETQKEAATKFVLGYTRRRDLLVPEWSDVGSLWLAK